MVSQNAKKYGTRFLARVQTEMFYDLFSRRLGGERLYINSALESHFLTEAESSEDSRIGELISKWHEQQIPVVEAELAKQEMRFNDAEISLQSKHTKKAEESRRIATDKIAKLEKTLASHKLLGKDSDTNGRIFPLHYATMICVGEDGERVVRPVRYLMRPHNKDSSFDQKFNGCYNARFDTLESVPWWRDSLGKRHGILLISKFYENVAKSEYLKHNTITTPRNERDNLVVCFAPKEDQYMAVPALWDVWKGKDPAPLYSAAIVTDDPRPEVLRAGHDRTPIVLSEEGVEKWLNAVGRASADAKSALRIREYPEFTHAIIGAG